MEKILSLIEKHNHWRKNCINLIASENTMSPLAEKIYVSDLMHRYAEGTPFKRYYQGLKYVDEIEDLTEQIFKKHFSADFVDLRPISGTLANMAVFSALGKAGDKILTLGIKGGSHVSHESAGASGVLGFEIHHFNSDENHGVIDIEKACAKILEIKPKFIILGGSVILFPQPIRELKQACEKIGAKLVYDAAHVFGLVATGFFQDPLAEGADIITSSTHKTFPGPQGGIILGNIKESLQQEIKHKVFPGVLSNHHLHRIPSLYIALLEMEKFGKDYAEQTIKNAKKLAEELYNSGFDVFGKDRGFTESHQVLFNVRENGGGTEVAQKLEDANIILNKNILSSDLLDPKNPNGIRIGVQEMTRFGMKEEEMKKIADLIKQVVIEKQSPDIIKKDVIELRQDFQKLKFCFNSEQDL